MKCEKDYKDLKIQKRIGRESINAQVFIACDKKDNCKYVFKKMPLSYYSVDRLYRTYCEKNKISPCLRSFLNVNEVYKSHDELKVMIHSNWVEILVLNLCNILIKEKICFNLPRTYEYSFCEKCEYGAQHVNCALLVTDLADEGDLQSWLVKQDRSPTEIFAMMFQVFAGLYALRKYFNIIHNDMHAGNVLVKKIDKKDNSYLKYRIDGRDYYVPNIGYMFIVWDFGYSQIPNVVEIVEYTQLRQKDKNLYGSIDVIDYTKISSIIQHFLPQKYKSVKNIINDFIFKNAKKKIGLEGTLLLFGNYIKPQGKFKIIEEYSFDKKIKLPKKWSGLSNFKYIPRLYLGVPKIPIDILFSKDLQTLDKIVMSYDINKQRLKEYYNLKKQVLASVYPPLPSPKQIKINLDKQPLNIKRTLESMEDTQIRAQKKRILALKEFNSKDTVEISEPLSLGSPMEIDTPKVKTTSLNEIQKRFSKMKLS